MTHDKLHLGCGLTIPDGWLNVDGSMNARLAKFSFLRPMLAGLGLISRKTAQVAWTKNVFYHDVRRRLPWPDASFSTVYASHLLEHLYHGEGKRLMRECYRVLKPGGVLRIVVPDLRAVIDDYIASRSRPDTQWPEGMRREPCEELHLHMLFHDLEPPGGWFLLRWYRLRNPFHQHKWMYDERCLLGTFADAGFVNAVRKNYLESTIPNVQEVESRHRVENGGLAVEGFKPQ